MRARARPAVRVLLALLVWLAPPATGELCPAAAAQVSGAHDAQLEPGAPLVRQAPVRTEAARDPQLAFIACLAGPAFALDAARCAGTIAALDAVPPRPLARISCPVAARAPPRR